MAVALDRDMGTSWSRHLVEVECASELTRGMTIVDRLNVTHDPSKTGSAWKRALEAGVTTDICWTLDSAGFKAMMLEGVSL